MFEQTKAAKILHETQQFQVEDDSNVLRLMLGPANIQHLLQESINGLIISLTQVIREEIEQAQRLGAGRKRKHWDKMTEGEKKIMQIMGRPQGRRAKMDIGMISSFTESLGPSSTAGQKKPPALDQQKLLIQIASPINDLLEKLIYSIQKNQALYMDEKAREEQMVHYSTSSASNSLHNHQSSPSLHP